MVVREHLESLASLLATLHGRYPAGVLSTTNFVPDKIVIKYFLAQRTLSGFIMGTSPFGSRQRALLVLVTLFLI
jgi:hypothetical protein